MTVMRNFFVSRLPAPWCVGAVLWIGACDGGRAEPAEPASAPAAVEPEAAAPPSSPTPAEPAAEPAEPAEPAGSAAEPAEPAAEPASPEDVDEADGEDDADAPAKAPAIKTTTKSSKKSTAPAGGEASADEKTGGDASASSSAAAPNGKEIYGKKCKNCHGADGKADTKLGEKHDIDSWKEAGWSSKWTLAKIEEIVRDGKDGTKMKPFKDKLTAEEITAVSKYARSLGS